MRLLVVTIGLLTFCSAHAQLPDEQTGQNPLFDVSAPDSVEQKENIIPRVARYYPSDLWRGKWAADTLDLALASTHVWDEKDTLRGWLQTLGQVGKPYLRFQGGLPDYLTDASLYRNPLTLQPDVYLLNPGVQIPHYDTRTPYVVGHFHQAAARSQFLNLQFSQNITPFWNVNIYYNRRTSEGVNTRETVDHYNMAFSVTHQKFDKSFILLMNGSFSQFADEMHGGANLDPGFDEQELFEALLTPVQLQAANLRRRVRTFNGWSRLRLLGDSLRNASLILEAGYADYQQRYTDTSPPDSFDITEPYRPYGYFFEDADTLSELYTVRQLHAKGGLQLAVRVANLQGLVIGSLALERSSYLNTDSYTELLTQQRTTVGGFLALRDTTGQSGLRLEATGSFTLSDRFGPEQQLEITASYAPRKIRYELPDSQQVKRIVTWRWKPVTITGSYEPWRVFLEAHVQNRNPSVYQAYWRSVIWEPQANLNNEKVGQLQLGFTRVGPPKTQKGLPYLQNSLTVSAFASVWADPIYYDSTGQATQRMGRTPIQWAGLEIQAQRRLFSRFYGRFSATYQYTPRQNLTDIKRLQAALPDVHGRVSLFYEDKPFREAYAFFRIGLEARFFSAFSPLAFDPGNQVFYPGSQYRQQPFLRVDFIAETQLSPAAHMFLGWQFVNNLVMQSSFPGYVTTTLYPEWPAALTWGARYRFFD